MRRHRRAYEVMSEMNLTNLLDTAFVLLIAFIIVSPSVQHGLNIDLPQVASGALSGDTPKSVSITIKPDNGSGSEPIYIDGDTRVDLAGLQAALEAKRAAGNGKLDVVVEADRRSTYNTFAQVIGVLKNMNLEGIGLATDLPPAPDQNQPQPTPAATATPKP